ncbi:MAG: DUF3794 domain-containing protein [Bdellovibrionaceae bacterium]|nr:DUF3794 domain-containing protein [Pseudobdellovibrionaceae bacterium]
MRKFFSNKIFLSGLFLLIGGLCAWSVWGPSRSVPTTQGEVKTREDNQYVYYDVVLDRAKPTTVKVDVKEGKILITGQLEFKNKVDGQMQGFMSYFEKTIPAPGNVSFSDYQVDYGRGKIILKFQKPGSS